MADPTHADHQLQLVVDSLRDYAIYRLDPDGRVASWSLGAQRIKGYAPHEIIGMSVERFYTDEDRAADRPRRLLETAHAEGRAEDEGWRVRKDGTTFWANVVVTPLYDRDGHHLGFSKITRDLTERRNWEADRLQLVQANEAVRLRDEFLSIASHELRTPLMALQLQLDIVQQTAALDTELARKIARANRNAQRMADLVTALLDVGRIASGRLTLAPVEVDLEVLVRDVIEQLADTAAAARCQVTAELAPGIVGVWDPMRVAQVASNLLANAFKHAAGQPVEVTIERAQGMAALRVRDHGAGIAAEDRERVFARFERAAPSNLGGLGLGLYVAHQIVRAHGGTIRVDEADGGGAVFQVELPLPMSAVPNEAA